MELRKMKKSTLIIKNIRLKPFQIHKFRGFIGNLFSECDLIHNHDPNTGKTIYRYPLIQFKLIGGKPALIAITEEAVEIFTKIFMTLDEITLEGATIPVYEKDLIIGDVDFGYSEDAYAYKFISPWIGLNQKNFRRYEHARDAAQRNEILEKALVGNILSMAKSLGLWLKPTQRIKAALQVEETPVNLKAKTMIGFNGVFKANFILPDNLGIGKSVSRGFGSVRKII